MLSVSKRQLFFVEVLRREFSKDAKCLAVDIFSTALMRDQVDQCGLSHNIIGILRRREDKQPKLFFSCVLTLHVVAEGPISIMLRAAYVAR